MQTINCIFWGVVGMAFGFILTLRSLPEPKKPTPCIDNGMTAYKSDVINRTDNYVLYTCGDKTDVKTH